MTTTFDEALKATGLPDAALEPIRKAWEQAYGLVTKNNERVAQVNAAKAQDPNNLDYIDSLWASHAPNDPAMAEKEANYQALIAESEKLLKELRDFGRTKVQPPLSEEETKKVRQAVNESTSTIATAVEQAKAMVAIVDSMLATQGKAIEGGVITLMPQVDSLKNLRGRKASSGTTSYATRIGGFILNGRNIHRDGKSNFRYGADSVSVLMNSEEFPENKVTGEEIEEAFFKAIGKDFRSVKSTEIPESTDFEFSKEVKTGENTTELRKVNITIKRKVETSESATETKTDAKTEKVEAPKAEVPAKSEPAKKAAAPSATQAKK